jgi:hypothetical protein
MNVVLNTVGPSPLGSGSFFGPRSSADRAADFESACGGSTPPGAITGRMATRKPHRCVGHVCQTCTECAPRAYPGAYPELAASSLGCRGEALAPTRRRKRTSAWLELVRRGSRRSPRGDDPASESPRLSSAGRERPGRTHDGREPGSPPPLPWKLRCCDRSCVGAASGSRVQDHSIDGVPRTTPRTARPAA